MPSTLGKPSPKQAEEADAAVAEEVVADEAVEEVVVVAAEAMEEQPSAETSTACTPIYTSASQRVTATIRNKDATSSLRMRASSSATLMMISSTPSTLGKHSQWQVEAAEVVVVDEAVEAVE